MENITTKIFSVENPEQSSCSLIGRKEETDKIVADLEHGFSREGKTQNERVFYFRVPVEMQDVELPVDKKYWNFWTAVVREFAKVISVEVLENLKVADSEEFEYCYNYFNSDIEKDEGYLLAGSNLNQLLDLYTDNKIHIILVFTEVENILRLYPDEVLDAMFVEWLFSISIKGAVKSNLSILLVSEQGMEVYQKYLGRTTSLMTDGYPTLPV